MKKILLALCLCFIVAAWVNASGVGTNNRIVLVSVSATDSAFSPNATLRRGEDGRHRKLAQVRQICQNRGVAVEEYEWDGDVAKFKEILCDSADNYDFSVFVGGYSRTPENWTQPWITSSNHPGDSIYFFWQPDTNYNKLSALVWFGNDAREASANYTSGAGGTDYDLDTYTYFGHYTHGYTGALDTFYQYSPKVDLKGFASLWDSTTTVTPYLKYTAWPKNGGENYMSFWSRENHGVTHYYSSLQDGTFGLVVDAIICKHIDSPQKLYYSYDMDDFGMHYHSWMSTLANGDPKLNHDNFFAPFEEFLQDIVDRDLKLTIGAVTKYLRDTTVYVDTFTVLTAPEVNQWEEWWDLRDIINDNPDNFCVILHNHGFENAADSSAYTFSLPCAWREFSLTNNNLPTVSLIDSLYSVSVESLNVWFDNVADYCIPPGDNLDGPDDSTSIQDTLADFFASRNMGARAKCSTTGNSCIYPSTVEYRGGKFLNCTYLSVTTDTIPIPDSDIGGRMYTYFFAPMFFNDQSNTGQNPQTEMMGWWSTLQIALEDYEYTGSTASVGVLHPTACKSKRNLRLIGTIEDTIDWLEWLAGKDIYECVFSYELAEDHWDQVRD